MTNQRSFTLKTDWDYFPHFEQAQGHFVGRKEESDKVVNWFVRRDKGCFLISGERGVGKTALVYEAIRIAKEKDKTIVPVLLNSSQLVLRDSAKSEELSQEQMLKVSQTIIINLIRRLYTGCKDKINRSHRKDLEQLYKRAVATRAEFKQEFNQRKIDEAEQETVAESKVSLDPNHVKYLIGVLGATVGVEIIEKQLFGNFSNILAFLAWVFPLGIYFNIRNQVKVSNKKRRENSVDELYIMDNNLGNLEHELYTFLEKVKDSKIIFVIDEMDKLEGDNQVILTAFKNLFTLASGMFVFIASEATYNMLQAAKIKREITYTLYNDTIFVKRPNFKDLENYIEEIQEKPVINNPVFEEFKNILCYQAQSDYFELHFKIRDYIEGYNNRNNPLLKVGNFEIQDYLQSKFQKILGQMYEVNYYEKPSAWHKNNELLKGLYAFFDELLVRGTVAVDNKMPPALKPIDKRVFQAKKNAIAYMLRLGFLAKGEEIDAENGKRTTYVLNRKNIDVPKTPDYPLDYEEDFLTHLKKFAILVNQIESVVSLCAKGKAVPLDTDKLEVIANANMEPYIGMPVHSIYEENKPYKESLKLAIPQHIPREQLEAQTAKIKSTTSKIYASATHIFLSILKLVDFENFDVANFDVQPQLFTSTMLSIREHIIKEKTPYFCLFRKEPLLSRQILVTQNLSSDFYNQIKPLINEHSRQCLIININTDNQDYNLEYWDNKDKVIHGFFDVKIQGDFTKIAEVLDLLKKRDSEKISHKSEFESLLKVKPSLESLTKYEGIKFSGLSPAEHLQKTILEQIDGERYKTIKDIDDVLETAKPFIDKYKNENPVVFKNSTDFITKSLGFSDIDFRKKHHFGEETLKAFNNYKA